jgi:hypothetical protein
MCGIRRLPLQVPDYCSLDPYPEYTHSNPVIPLSKQSLKFSLHPTAIAMLERVLQTHDRTKLTRQQIAYVAPLKEAVRIARNHLNLMARSEIVYKGARILVYPHPDQRETGALMVYDRRDEILLVETPFTGTPDEAEIEAWIDAQSDT